jgi:hypothetical protein
LRTPLKCKVLLELLTVICLERDSQIRKLTYSLRG